MIDPILVLTHFKDILFAHGDVIITLISNGLDIVEHNTGDIYALEAKGVDAVVVQFLFDVGLEDYFEGFCLLEQPIDYVDEFLDLLGVFGCQGFFLHEIEKFDLFQLRQDAQYILCDLLESSQGSLLFVSLTSNCVLLLLGHVDDHLADL